MKKKSTLKFVNRLLSRRRDFSSHVFIIGAQKSGAGAVLRRNLRLPLHVTQYSVDPEVRRQIEVFGCEVVARDKELLAEILGAPVP